MRGTFVKEVFQGRETKGVGNFGVKGSDINSRHNVLGGTYMILRKWLISLIHEKRELTIGWR